VTRGRTSYSRALNSFDVPSILDSLSEDVRIQMAVYDEPLRGKASAGFLFGILTEELAPFDLLTEIVEGNRSVVLFETSLRGVAAHGLSVVEYQADGLVGELTVFFRPLAVLGLLADVIGDHMERRFGPPKSRR
jgi:hypothetical protein